MKLSEKFARQETEEARLARLTRRRLSQEQATAVRRFLGDTPSVTGRVLVVEDDARIANLVRELLGPSKCSRQERANPAGFRSRESTAR